MLRIWDGLIKLIDLATALCVVAMVGIVAVQIFLRYVLSHPFVWADELANWLFVWVIYLGSSVLVRYDAHLTVGIVTDHLSPRVNLWRRFIVNLLVLSFLILLFVQTMKLMQKFGAIPSAAMHVPMAFFYGCGMIFATIALIEYARQTLCLGLLLSGRMLGAGGRGSDRRDLETSVHL